LELVDNPNVGPRINEQYWWTKRAGRPEKVQHERAPRARGEHHWVPIVIMNALVEKHVKSGD
jgi:hypothetical protein